MVWDVVDLCSLKEPHSPKAPVDVWLSKDPQVCYMAPGKSKQSMFTSFHSILQRVSTVHQQLLQVFWLLWELQAEPFQAFLQLVRVMEVKHFGAPVKGRLDVCQENVHQSLEETLGQVLAIAVRKQICTDGRLTSLSSPAHAVTKQPSAGFNSTSKSWNGCVNSGS